MTAHVPERLSRGRKAFYVVVLLISCVLLYFFWVRGMRFFKVPTGSMIPSILPGDFILTLEDGTYDRGEIVVLQDPVEHDDTLYDVKRIVAVGGDTVEIKWGAVLLNGSYASEPYTREPIEYNDMEPYTVPPGEVFLLGDNRNESEDSSVWAQRSVPVDAIVGKVRLIYLPFSRWQRIRHFPLRNVAEARTVASPDAGP